MIDKYYNGVIEQVYTRIGKTDKNIVMAQYNNDFSIGGLENIKKYSRSSKKVYFAWHEYDYDVISGAYEPFLDTVCDIYRRYIKGDFAQFLEECEVYPLQREVLSSYYEKGVCTRQEGVLLDEVGYEQECMTKAIATMLKKIADIRPVVIVINRFQMASKSTMELVHLLLMEPSPNIGIVLGCNDTKFRSEKLSAIWKGIVEAIENHSLMYSIGSTGKCRGADFKRRRKDEDYESRFLEISNCIELLDFEQAQRYFQNLEHQIKFEEVTVPREVRLRMYLMYAKVSILLSQMSKVLELVEEISKLKVPGKEKMISYESTILLATCYMYQGRLEKAAEYAQLAKKVAEEMGNEEEVFQAELLAVQAKMSGWYNIFFFVQDIPIDESLIEKLIKYNFRNNLAHIYVYAYDNRPEVVAKAYRSEEALVYFSKGLALAKEIGNAHLVRDAYQKNIMLASTNGMNEIALLYTVRTYQFMQDSGDLYAGRNFSGIGYNLSALGYNEKANECYHRSLELFYKLRMPMELAEVYYNQSMNNIMLERFAEAEHDLQIVMKVIERLHLNSLRVANLSKIYAMLALTCILQNDRFNCERYLISCRQFLNYIIAQENENKHKEIIHDYAKCDDDMFLYTFSLALMNWVDGDNEGAFANYEKAEKFLEAAEGNQFFSYRLFRKKRMELYGAMGRTELYEREKASLEQYEEMNRQISRGLPEELLKEVDLGGDYTVCRIPEKDLELLFKQEGLALDYQNNKRQMDFISTWQKIIDVTDTDVESMVEDAMRTFLNHFSTDRALYVWYEGGLPKVLYNDTGVTMTPKVLKKLEGIMKGYPQGFAVSMVNDSFFEYQDVISMFDVNAVCSFVAVPFFKSGRLTSLMLTYVQMKDNWHSSISRYMLNEDDLNIYQMLFRELSYSINRMEANQAVRNMNRKLQEAAVTDVLTGIYNRMGMYEEIKRMTADAGKYQGQGLGLMFIDLDNFKPYNDTFGHDVGDIILIEMARIFRRVVADKGFVSRYGGDEFIIILYISDRDELERIVKEIYRRIEVTEGFKAQIESYMGHKIEVEKSRLITCSIGIAYAESVEGEESINELIRKADDLLYSVKAREKGHYAFI